MSSGLDVQENRDFTMPVKGTPLHQEIESPKVPVNDKESETPPLDGETRVLMHLSDPEAYDIQQFNAALNQLIASRKDLKEAADSLAALAEDPGTPEEALFSMQKLISSLIDFSRSLQAMAAAYSDKLLILSKELEYFSKETTQIPAGESDEKLSQKFGNMLQIVQSLKDKVEQQTKTVTNQQSNMKDSYSSIDDYIGTLTSLLQQIIQQLMRG